MARGIPGCKICSNESVKAQVNRMFSEGLSDARVVKALGSIGVSIAETSVFRHRHKHYHPDEVKPVEYDENMEITRPKVVEIAPPINSEAAALLDSIQQQVDNETTDITRARMIREALLSKIFEQHLALTSTALDRYINGEGRYPTDAVKGLQSIHSIFEKTTLHKSVEHETASAVMMNEVARREHLAYTDGLEKGKTCELEDFTDESISLVEAPTTHLTGYNAFADKPFPFYFGGKQMDGVEFTHRINFAWQRGLHESLKNRGLLEAAADIHQQIYGVDTDS